MSAHLDRAKETLEDLATYLQNKDSLRIAEVFAAVAQADALDRIALQLDKLDGLTDLLRQIFDYPIRVESSEYRARGGFTG